MTTTITADAPEVSAGQDPVRCQGFTKKGLPCASPVVNPDSGFCNSHDPARAAEMESWRALGGKATSQDAAIERKLLRSGDLGAVAQALTSSIAELRSGPITPGSANAIASLSRAYLATREAAMNERRMDRMLAVLEDKLGGVVDVEELKDWEVGDE